jgi:hypothetical protein
VPTHHELLEPYRKALVGLPLSHVWRGRGSAIFLEFGRLTPRLLKDGTPGSPDGEITAMIEWSWRIENGVEIVCGSFSEEEVWPEAFEGLHGRVVTDVQVFGRLPELYVSLEGDVHVASFMTAGGEPAWALIDHRPKGLRTIHILSGAIAEEP